MWQFTFQFRNLLLLQAFGNSVSQFLFKVVVQQQAIL
ncbi:hypothetical protein D917_09428 [Trichinella nativa]|uniref:Uncharacterized protein n=1 Tax=Trichinella nativa TaxID=6335 RepID=A0A1Y3EFT6_9BILA|nr:hypothetical protein D917_09428 [Trichinella nativa]